MSKRQDILNAAEAAFERKGFHAVPVDQIISGAGVSPRTLYAHFPSKEALAVAVLEERHRRYLDKMEEALDAADPLAALFGYLEAWLRGSRSPGCLFLRALGEFGEVAVSPSVNSYKTELRALVARLVARQGGGEAEADEIFLLVEGATALAPNLGPERAVAAARRAAERLLNGKPPGETV